MRQMSQEWYVGTEEGVLKVRDLKEIVLEKEKWSATLVKGIKGLP